MYCPVRGVTRSRVRSCTVDCTVPFGKSLTSGSEFYSGLYSPIWGVTHIGSEFYSRLYSPIWGIAHIRLRVLQSTVLSHSGSYSQQVQSSTVDCNLPFGESITSGSRVLQWTVISHLESHLHQAQSSTVDCNLPSGE